MAFQHAELPYGVLVTHIDQYSEEEIRAAVERLQTLVSSIQPDATMLEIKSRADIANYMRPGSEYIPYFRTSNLAEVDEGRNLLLKFLA